MGILLTLANEFNVKNNQIENAVSLIDEGNTIPFIARYRKEMTGGLDDQILREINIRLNYLRNLEEKRIQATESILEQEKLTDDIREALQKAKTLAEIDDIYRLFRPKRRTRAIIAKEKGLEPLAILIFNQEVNEPLENIASKYINEEKQVLTVEDAISGAMDIIAEIISDDYNYRSIIREMIQKEGFIVSKAKKEESQSVYEMYYDFYEPISKIAGHRILAINRGEKDGILSVKVDIECEKILDKLYSLIITKDNHFVKQTLCDAITDGYKRLIFNSIETEIRNNLTEKAEDGAIKVFGKNLKQLLMQSPIKDKVVLAIDPGFRTGCKLAVIDGIGKVLETGVIYPTKPVENIEKSREIVHSMYNKYHFDIIAIGNGTASRESEQFVVDYIKDFNLNVYYIIVNEAGASVYSASKLAFEEFPDYDVSLRSAVSIGRRLQDPLAELVKIDPKSIGVGQYQHDMNQKIMDTELKGVVESCVNNVGVDLNTASSALLSYVSGVNFTISKNIIKFREENGAFNTRKELLKVKGLGPKAFQQCAGFLRIADGKQIFDNTAVHPESYDVAKQLLELIGMPSKEISLSNVNIMRKVVDIDDVAKKLNIGVPTLVDIINELEKPGRDPRDEMPKPILRSDILEMENLLEGMTLKGTIRNVIDFGAFVDIGVHQDGLVHISEMTEKYIKHPLEVVGVGDIVDVRVISVDIPKKRIALSMKGI